MEITDTDADNLRRENEELRRQLHELKRSVHHQTSESAPALVWHPSRLTIWAILLATAILLVVAFVAGYLPLQKRRALLANEQHEQQQTLPRVEVIQVMRSPGKSGLQLPGSIQAITEAPILARADGYVKQRLVDIGDRVRAGQTVAVIEAPELDEQVRQAEANSQQAKAALEQASANLRQGRSELELARVTAQRWGNLVKDGSVSVQENDQYQAQYISKIAGVEALEHAIVVQRSGVAAAEANTARLERMKSYRVVTAPFDGVVTLRNVDEGALVNTGTTLLYRIAQTATLRLYVNVPQTDANAIHNGDTASLTVSNLPGRQFAGVVARTANSLDPASRTLLVEVHVRNLTGELLPGMYAEVNLVSSRPDPPLLVPSDALIARGQGAQVAVVRADRRVHLQTVEVGRDYGDRLEVTRGLEQGQSVIANPGDVVQEGAEVEPVPVAQKPAPESTAQGSTK